MRHYLACAALALGLSTAPAWAGTVSEDVKCVVAALALAQSPAPEVKAGAPQIIFYYLGRLNGATERFDLEGALAAEISALTNDTLRVESARCAAEFQTIAAAFSAVGEKLGKRSGSEGR